MEREGDFVRDRKRVKAVEKISSGIEGFDDITGGGLPRGRTTLLMGGPGCGKTVLALQALVNGATSHSAPGIFVAFEENADLVRENAESFGWNVVELQKKLLYFLNAQLTPDVVKAGAFDLTALLAGLEAKAIEMAAKLVVFDALDVLLSLLDDPAAERRELYRIQAWLKRSGLTGILTTKVEDSKPGIAERCGFMPFMADCVVLLRQRVLDRVAVRELRVVKYRGSSHVLNEVPFIIGADGIEVGASNGVHPEPQPFKERVSTGIGRLDEMLNGGIYRGTNALVTGSAGTGKSTLSGLFVEAACRRGERVLFVSFDENSRDIVRDLASVSVQLAPHLKSGLLRMESVRTESAASEDHLIRIKRLIREHQPACVAIDPFSALVKVGGEQAARNAAERLIYFCRNERITLLFTSLLEGRDAALETTPIHVSTLADTWLQISYSLDGGERNRALTIIKSRGSKHSNQVRELIFSDSGITLADPYTAGGAVLMGTLRIEKENSVGAEHDCMRTEIEQKRREIELIQIDHDLRLESAKRSLQNREEELVRLDRVSQPRPYTDALRQDAVVRRRDDKLVRDQTNGDTPTGGKPRTQPKARRKKS
jgi:circadian clock protein KaiC